MGPSLFQGSSVKKCRNSDRHNHGRNFKDCYSACLKWETASALAAPSVLFAEPEAPGIARERCQNQAHNQQSNNGVGNINCGLPEDGGSASLNNLKLRRPGGFWCLRHVVSFLLRPKRNLHRSWLYFGSSSCKIRSMGRDLFVIPRSNKARRSRSVR